MRIGINLLYLIPGVVGGVETYARSLVTAILRSDKRNQYVIFVNSEASHLEFLNAPNVIPVKCGFRATRRVVRYAWEQCVLPVQAITYKLDVLHSLGYVGPIVCRCPTIVTIHDLNYVQYRGIMPEHRRLALRYCSTRSAAKARFVITISEFSKRQIVDTLHIPETRVKTIYYGLGWETEDQRPAADGCAQDSSIRDAVSLRHPYIVAFTGDCYVQKNVPRLIEAYERVVRSHAVDLVLIGRISPAVQQMIAATRGNIITAGVIRKAPSSPVFREATVCVVPSTYEGFGLPLVEAQRAGIPLVCSAAACLPEVAGNGALYFDPLSVEGMAQSIVRCLDDPKLRAQMVVHGNENCLRFSWQKAARETLDLYHRVVESTPL